MSLTDDWKAERLKKEKDYFVKTLSNGKIYPAHLYDDNSFSFCGNRTEYFPVESTDIEVLAPCDYEERVNHIDTMAKQGAEIERLRKENDNLSAIITGGELEIGHLRTLLKECKPYIQKEMETIKGANFCNCDWAWKTYDFLTRVNVALGESEEQ